jgi:hypothetical protein
MGSKWKGQSHAELATAAVDTGRRGMPRPGCDCVQCFGYCLIDGDKADHCVIESHLQRRKAEREDL